MRAILKTVTFKDCVTKDNKKFKVVNYTVDVTNEDTNEVKTYRGSMSCDYGKKYFEKCGYTSKSAIGCVVDVTLRKRAYTTKEGEQRVVTEVKYMNFIDTNGEKIFLDDKNNEDTAF